MHSYLKGVFDSENTSVITSWLLLVDKLDAREKWYEIYYKEKKVNKTGGKNKVFTTQIIQKRILPEAPFLGVRGVFGVEVLLSWSKLSFSIS